MIRARLSDRYGTFVGYCDVPEQTAKNVPVLPEVICLRGLVPGSEQVRGAVAQSKDASRYAGTTEREVSASTAVSEYPLSWPAGWKRTTSRRGGRFFFTAETIAGNARIGQKPINVETALNRIFSELEKLGVPNGEALVSTNLELNTWGIPRGNQREPADPGVAVYWEVRGTPQCMAIDVYTRVADNLAAVAASLEALRAIERHGGAAIMERAFLGFAALPEKAGARRPWREVLHFGAATASRQAIEERFRELAKSAHGDVGGSHNAMVELNLAREDALRELDR
jgi:hypothetical protein